MSKITDPKEAKRIYDQEWRKKNLERIREQSKQYYQKNKDRYAERHGRNSAVRKEQMRAWSKRNAKGIREKILRQNFGVSPEFVESLYEQQSRKCAICFTEAALYGPRDKILHLDHCHKSGKVRGLLCSKCNKGIGLLGDSIKNLEGAISYLNKSKS